ncbi:Immunoglobulin subtype,Immunoglobulin-like domain,Immunoglobulin-like fold,Immunoglobulin subtype [Cinara cedri]|uniref:Immunoglobulin subtype,Immunoglobulin-like domain,Immunoglobulin-like fold,Immunoglobulin subtype n=1 Tax=Cinara cedri TaxID=506608 RepID=A0A5E4NLE7_9HEMI|nr:Immunoglobulin subtype,Immunoglobulin-like domain,Immunoglobulin-like fold,Immunoglobulin subtype [Cinara cedri]
MGVATVVGTPKFGEDLNNVTVSVGREAVFICNVEKLATYKVAWLRVDTQTILTIHSHVITKNHRIAVTHTDHRIWFLHIREVREADRGWYMCQINTDPMKSQQGYLQVVVPPNILDYPTSNDMVLREGGNVSMQCSASGFPTPNITWRREGGALISVTPKSNVLTVNGPWLNISKVDRLQMGAYLCIASNGIPPTVSKRIMLITQFPPTIWVQNQLVGAQMDQSVTLECMSEAFPKSINYWTRNKTILITNGTKYHTALMENMYKTKMKLTILSVTSSDFGPYQCVSKNSLADTDGNIKLYDWEHMSENDKDPTNNICPKSSEKFTVNHYRRNSRDDNNEHKNGSTGTVVRPAPYSVTAVWAMTTTTTTTTAMIITATAVQRIFLSMSTCALPVKDFRRFSGRRRLQSVRLMALAGINIMICGWRFALDRLRSSVTRVCRRGHGYTKVSHGEKRQSHV